MLKQINKTPSTKSSKSRKKLSPISEMPNIFYENSTGTNCLYFYFHVYVHLRLRFAVIKYGIQQEALMWLLQPT